MAPLEWNRWGGALLALILMLLCWGIGSQPDRPITLRASAQPVVTLPPMHSRLAHAQVSSPHPGVLPFDAEISSQPHRGQFIRFFRMQATAYLPTATRMEGGRYTCTRRDGQAVHGVAVDPSLIPLGSRLWIPGYGHAIADDVGGAIHGHHVDVRVQERRHMHQWGRKPVLVYVLAEPAPASFPRRH